MRDTFGGHDVVSVAQDDQWSMFVPAGPPGGPPHLVVPSVTVSPLRGPVVEEVRFVRDELANLVWGVEAVVTDEAGDIHDLAAEYTARVDDAARVVDLVEAVLPRPNTWGVMVLTAPRSSILRELRGQRVPEEEVGSTGVTVRRRWSLARSADGGRHAWVSRSASTGRGEGSSGLAFDVALDVRGQ